jgi:hypothetical protein
MDISTFHEKVYEINPSHYEKVFPSMREDKTLLLLGWHQSKYSVYDQNFITTYDTTYDHSVVPKIDKLSPVINDLAKLSDIEASLTYFRNAWSGEKQLVERIIRRVTELQDLYYADYVDEESQVSIDSLKAMLMFLLMLDDFNYPVIALSEDGLFHVSWRKDNANLMTLRFKEGNFLDYVIFRPSQHVKKPIILNGSMNLFDFETYLNMLGLHVHLLKG